MRDKEGIKELTGGIINGCHQTAGSFFFPKSPMRTLIPEHQHPRLGLTSSSVVVFSCSVFPLGCYLVISPGPPDRIPACGDSLCFLELFGNMSVIEVRILLTGQGNDPLSEFTDQCPR